MAGGQYLGYHGIGRNFLIYIYMGGVFASFIDDMLLSCQHGTLYFCIFIMIKEGETSSTEKGRLEGRDAGELLS